MALPHAAAVVDLLPPVLLPELADIFHTPGSLELPLEEHPSKLPAMFMMVEDWAGVARKLMESGLAHVIPYEEIPRSHARSLSSGLFGVEKPGTEKRRVIVDRRRKNACERSLREAACLAAVVNNWSETKLMETIREMTLPHPMQFKDLFLTADSELRIDTKDARDYFYLMALPQAQRNATPIGWPLKRRELGVGGNPEALVMLCLTVPAMGSKHSMEVAQAAHHGVMREAGVLSPTNWITLGWSPPKGREWVGCYCDDLGLISIELSSPHCRDRKKEVGREPQSEGEKLSTKAELGYTAAKFVVKREKCKDNQREATVWGAELSSRRKDLGCPVEKIACIAHITWRLVRAETVVTKHLEVLLGLGGHALLHCRIAMSLMSFCFTWLHELVGRRAKCARWHARAKDELIGLAVCWPLFRSALDSCIHPTLLATDATLSKAGGVTTRLSPEQAVALWSRQRWKKVGLSYQGVEGDLTQPLFWARTPLIRDEVMEKSLQSLQFREAFRYRFRDKKHINFQDLLAWRTGIKMLSRDAAMHGTRLLCILDSQVVACSIQKGRSTSHRLNSLLHSICGTCLLTHIEPIALWVSSSADAADDPTRVSRVRTAVPGDSETDGFWRGAEAWTWPLEATRRE
eukprot:397147-Amphidinium_carterae.1